MQMRSFLLAGILLAFSPTFAGWDLFAAAPGKGSQKGKKPKSPEQTFKEKQSKAQAEFRKRVAGQKKDSPRYKSAEKTLREQLTKAQFEYRRQVSEQQRKRQAEAEAKRKKELEQARKRRNEQRLSSMRKEVSASLSRIPRLEGRMQGIKAKRKKLREGIRLVSSKAKGEKFRGILQRLDRLSLDLESKGKELAGLTKDLITAKSSSSGGGKSGGSATPAGLQKMEERALDVKRTMGRVDLELDKAEAHYKSSAQLLFFCVGELVRGGVNFSPKEKTSIRALSPPSG